MGSELHAEDVVDDVDQDEADVDNTRTRGLGLIAAASHRCSLLLAYDNGLVATCDVKLGGWKVHS